jgi:exopolysaccharide biosynthesis polyprenyl glycosylphosphotransferase
MKNNASFLYSLCLIFVDALALVAAFVSAYILRVTWSNVPIANPVSARTYLLILVSLLPIWLLIFALIGLYNRSIYEKRFSEVGRLFVGTIIGTLLIVGFDYFSNDIIFPAKLVPVYGMGLTFVFLVLFRNIARLIRRSLFGYDLGISNVLIVGNTVATKELVDWLSDPKISGYRVIGIVGSHERLPRMKHYKTFSSAIENIKSTSIHSIMQTELFSETGKNNEILTYAQNNHIAYRFIPGNSELFVGNIDVELFQSSIPMIAVHQTALIGWGRIAKRLFDMLLSALAIIILSPLLLLIALMIFVFDPGRIFFRQVRVTRYNKTFRIFKFRTHKKKYNGRTPEEAFEIMGKPELAVKYRKNGDQLAHDPRVNLVGRFLRKTSLDELPQLFNVLKGDISLVGPRAIVPEEIEQAQAKNQIVSVKSGITGFAQISGRRDITYDERRKLDLYYVQNWSFWLDIVILIKTVRVVLGGRGNTAQ